MHRDIIHLSLFKVTPRGSNLLPGTNFQVIHLALLKEGYYVLDF